jgi:hypothetical protein
VHSVFPTTPDALTEGWLSDVLGHDVAAFEIERFAAGVGVIGQVIRLRLRYRDGTPAGPATVIAKFAAPLAATRDVAALYDMYGREHRFYSHLSERVPIRVPRCHRSEFRADDQTLALVLEDLVDHRVGDQIAGTSFDEARRAIHAMAALHAAFWEPDLSDSAIAWLPVHDNATQAAGMQGGFALGWPVVSARLPAVIPDGARAAAERVHDAVPKVLQRMCTGPLALVHADMRLDNMFFGRDGIALVDWQSVCLSAPEQDVAYFVTQSLADDVRRRHGEQLLREYHDALAAHGVHGYSFETCATRYRWAALYLVCYAVTIAGTLDMGNERGLLLAETLLGRCLRSIDELDAWELL